MATAGEAAFGTVAGTLAEATGCATFSGPVAERVANMPNPDTAVIVSNTPVNKFALRPAILGLDLYANVLEEARRQDAACADDDGIIRQHRRAILGLQMDRVCRDALNV